MIDKNILLKSIQHEINVVKHLASKIKPEHLTYKPSEKQRSMLELLQYLSYAAYTSTVYIKTNDWSQAKKHSEDALKVNLSNFSAAMDDQYKKIEKEFSNLNADADVKTPWGVTEKADQAILDMPVKFLVGYRMQLFLYLKAVGVPNIGTSNCWGGIDSTPKS